MIVEIIYDAKCKHCKYFKYMKLKKLNSEEYYKKPRAYCSNENSDYFNLLLTLKSKACNKSEL